MRLTSALLDLWAPRLVEPKMKPAARTGAMSRAISRTTVWDCLSISIAIQPVRLGHHASERRRRSARCVLANGKYRRFMDWKRISSHVILPEVEPEAISRIRLPWRTCMCRPAPRPPIWRRRLHWLERTPLSTGAAADTARSARIVCEVRLRFRRSIEINHQSQFPVVTLSFNLAPGASLGGAVQHIRQVTQELDMPASIEASFQGHGPRVRIVARKRVNADHCGHRHGVHRSRHAV